MSRDKIAVQVAEALEIPYAYALRLKRGPGAGHEGADLIHACREAMEAEEKTRKSKNRELARRQRGVLPKGAGGVRCTSCGASACADGKGSPIILDCAPDCPTRFYPKVKGHLYDAGHPRDDSNGCIFVMEALDPDDEDVVCGLSEARHAHSEYGEDQ